MRLRSGHGSTTSSVFATPERVEARASRHVAWDDLGGLKNGIGWSIATAREHPSFQLGDLSSG